MTASAAAATPPPRETRKAVRKSIRAAVVIGTRECSFVSAELSDLSMHGCNIVVGQKRLRVGQFIAIRWRRTKPFLAIVRWTRSGHAGVEFAQPISRGLAKIIATLD